MNIELKVYTPLFTSSLPTFQFPLQTIFQKSHVQLIQPLKRLYTDIRLVNFVNILLKNTFLHKFATRQFNNSKFNN
jgi:hypothetical protein